MNSALHYCSQLINSAMLEEGEANRSQKMNEHEKRRGWEGK